MAGAAALLAGAVALLFLLLESGVAGDPARAEAGPRAGAAELAAARARLGMVKDFHAAALRLELDGPPRRLSLLAAGGALVLREGADLERARVPLAGLPLTVAADRLAGAAATLAPPARLRVTVIPELAQRPAQGLLAALADARVDLEPGAPATLPWAESVPLPRRLGARVWAVARLDFGTDRNGRPILPEIAARGARSLAYALPAFLLTTVLALTLAMACAARRGWLDRALTMLAGIVMAASSLALIPLIRRLLTAEWELLPLRPWSAPYLPLLALPALTWILIAVWPELRLYRALALEESARPWLRAARARAVGAASALGAPCAQPGRARARARRRDAALPAARFAGARARL